MVKLLILAVLTSLARRVVATQRPTVIAITGSVGKSSTRQAVETALHGSFAVTATPGNLNNEWGIPFTILLGAHPGKSLWQWIVMGCRGVWFSIVRSPAFAQVLLLEYGADKPGDIAHLCSIAAPDVAIVTAISPVHLVNYRSLDELIAEKRTLVERVKPGGLVLLSADDQVVCAMQHNVSSAEVRFFGKHSSAEASVESVEVVRLGNQIEGRLRCRLGETHVALTLHKVTPSKGAVQAILAAFLVAQKMGISTAQCAARLEQLEPVHQRFETFFTPSGALIVDDSYNAAPASLRASLAATHQLLRPLTQRFIVCVGHMAELGPLHDQEHQAIGRFIAELAPDKLYVVGERARLILEAAWAFGLSKAQTDFYTDADTLAAQVHPQDGELWFIKGSRSAAMDKIVDNIRCLSYDSGT